MFGRVGCEPVTFKLWMWFFSYGAENSNGACREGSRYLYRTFFWTVWKRGCTHSCQMCRPQLKIWLQMHLNVTLNADTNKNMQKGIQNTHTYSHWLGEIYAHPCLWTRHLLHCHLQWWLQECAVLLWESVSDDGLSMKNIWKSLREEGDLLGNWFFEAGTGKSDWHLLWFVQLVFPYNSDQGTSLLDNNKNAMVCVCLKNTNWAMQRNRFMLFLHYF